MLRDVYADDNAWLFGIYLGYDLKEFLHTGFVEMRREPLGVFFYLFFLPYRLLENPYVVWHSLVVATQVPAALLFYGLVHRVCGERSVAVLAAAALIVLPLDHAMPYLSTFNYRFGLVLALASLYLTDRAAQRGKWGWEIPAALLLTGFAEYVLSEAMVALEPARLVLLWYRLAPGRGMREAVRAVTLWLLPFAVLSLPLVAYKLLMKPYGMYAGMYDTGLANLFDWRAYAKTARLFLLGDWWVLRRMASHGHAVTPLLAVAAAALAFVALRRHFATGEARSPSPPGGGQRLLVFSLSVLCPQLALFFYAGRSPNLGFDSTHAIFAQIGYASLLGLLAHRFLQWGVASGARALAAATAFAALAGAGIYFNNLRLDMFAAASREQDHFWQVFRQRFPQLPETSDWLIDARPRPYRKKAESFYEWEDLHATYDLEFEINRRYEPPSGPGRRHRVYTWEEVRNDLRRLSPAQLSGSIERVTHYGEDRLDTRGMTVVLYREGRMFLNEEILKQDPKTPYAFIADKPLPPYARGAQGR